MDNLVTSYYLKYHRVASTKEIAILDAGCGTGFQTLALARANPGSRVIGIDLSEKSIELARARLQYHNCQDVEFRVLNILDLPQLGLEFDYINCDEVLYLFPDPAVGLQALKSVLKPNGIIRANLHSALQRADLYRAQAAFRLIGLFDQNPEDTEVAAVQTMMKSLPRWVNVKERTWRSQLEQAEATESMKSNQIVVDTAAEKCVFSPRPPYCSYSNFRITVLD
ncbi:class I SAM-dependent methyltransferase [Pleurocapsales cyanobacterium LEGE 06147]|nr:class I SAM-dependent methyltransferase [Pleurocapsales cyanobacterium LEGE 06147]